MELREILEPSPGNGEVKIEVKVASICGSDLHIRRGDIGIPMRYPVVPGHEFAGIIKEAGNGVSNSLIGARVTGENTRSACGKCRHCASELIKVKPIITHTFPLSEWRQAFDLFESAGAIKVIFDMSEKKIMETLKQ